MANGQRRPPKWTARGRPDRSGVVRHVVVEMRDGRAQLALTGTSAAALLDDQGLVDTIRACGNALVVRQGGAAPPSGDLAASEPSGRGPRTVGVVPVIPAALHDAWCGWAYRGRGRLDGPELAHCAGCGLLVHAAVNR